MKSHGFTLIELMIVVTIISFLAALGIPQYFKYQAKARQAEVALNLSSLHTAQQAYFAENGKYTNVLSGENGIGWRPQGSFYYSYGFNFPGAQEGVHFFTGKLGAPKESLGQTSLAQEEFIAGAAGDIRGNKKIDVWSIDHARNFQHVQNGID